MKTKGLSPNPSGDVQRKEKSERPIGFASGRKFYMLALLLMGLVATTGCQPGATASEEKSDFVPGAFPPTLTDMEYHADSWTRSDCLACHEKGMQDAPIVEHKSLTAEAVEAKCRSCHVFIRGSKPE